MPCWATFGVVTTYPDLSCVAAVRQDGSFDPRACNDTNRIDLRVLPNPGGHVRLMAVLDNLGKGAAGLAIQNLNTMLGLPEARGLSA